MKVSNNRKANQILSIGDNPQLLFNLPSQAASTQSLFESKYRSGRKLILVVDLRLAIQKCERLLFMVNESLFSWIGGDRHWLC